MKVITSLLLAILCLLYFNSFGQSTEIDRTWDNLKNGLLRRSEVIIEFSEHLSKSEMLENQVLEQSVKSARILMREQNEIKEIDSLTINSIKAKNDDLTAAFSKVLKLLKYQTSVNTDEVVAKYLLRLEGADNRVFIEKIVFNKACRANKKPDTEFGNDDHSNIIENYYN